MEERVSELRQESKNNFSRRWERTKDFESKKKKSLQELSDSIMRANIRIIDTPEREKERGQKK